MTETISTYPPELLVALESAFSPERLRQYKMQSGNDLSKALDLYVWNTSIGQALYAPLQTLEVTMRNAMNRQLVSIYGSKWYENKKPVLFNESQFEKIEKAIARFDKGRTMVLADLVADLSFGFWSNLLEHKMYDELWKQCLHRAFPNKPKGTRRNNAAIPCTRLNTLRNRIAHHEPILNRDIEKDYAIIIDLLSWVCPLTASWTDSKNREIFRTIVESKPL